MRLTALVPALFTLAACGASTPRARPPAADTEPAAPDARVADADQTDGGPDAAGATGPAVAGLACCSNAAHAYDWVSPLWWTTDGRVWTRSIGNPVDDPSITFALTEAEPVEGFPPSVVELAAGHSHACALLRGGTVLCLGSGPGVGPGYPSMYDGTSQPVPVAGVDRVVQLAAGGITSCAIREDGTAACWGDATCAAPYSLTPPAAAPVIVPGVTDGAEVSVGSGGCCVRTRAGSVSCWGEVLFPSGPAQDTRQYSIPRPVEGLTDAVQISGGGFFACARTRAGRVACWGARGSLRAEEVPGVTDAVKVSAGTAHACALTRGGQVLCWGRNIRGQLGDGTLLNRPAPAPTRFRDAVDLSAGDETTCALSRDGTMRCAGSQAVMGPDVAPYSTRDEALRAGGLEGSVFAEVDVDADGVQDALINTASACVVARHRPEGWIAQALPAERTGACLGLVTSALGPLIAYTEAGHTTERDAREHHLLSSHWRGYRLVRAGQHEAMDEVFKDTIYGDVDAGERRFESRDGVVYEVAPAEPAHQLELRWNEDSGKFFQASCWQLTTEPARPTDAAPLCTFTRRAAAPLRFFADPRSRTAARVEPGEEITVSYPAGSGGRAGRTYCANRQGYDWGYLELTPAELARCRAARH